MFNTHTHTHTQTNIDRGGRLRCTLYRFICFCVSVSLIQQMTDSEWLFYALLRSIAIRIRHFSAPQCGWWSDRMFNPIVWDQHQSNCNCPGLHLLPVDVMVFSQNQIETGRNLEKILSKNDWITGLLDGSKPQQTSAATMIGTEADPDNADEDDGRSSGIARETVNSLGLPERPVAASAAPAPAGAAAGGKRQQRRRPMFLLLLYRNIFMI